MQILVGLQTSPRSKSTKLDLSWLPTSKICDCPSRNLSCLTRRELFELGSTVLNIGRRHRWEESHPARFVPELPERYIKLFSHKGQTVLDPFCGSGTTNIVAKKLERNSIGIDINPYSVKMSKQRLGQDGLFGNKTIHEIIEGDCVEMITKIPSNSIDLIVTSPPYFDMVDYNDPNTRQLGNIHNYRNFIQELEKAWAQCFRVLKPGSYLVINTQDVFKKDVKCPLHVDYLLSCLKIGFEIININVYILNFSNGGRLVFGYPVAYYPKNDHEFILILQKPKDAFLI